MFGRLRRLIDSIQDDAGAVGQIGGPAQIFGDRGALIREGQPRIGPAQYRHVARIDPFRRLERAGQLGRKHGPRFRSLRPHSGAVNLSRAV
jgi:hypothetical protein